MLNPNIVDSKHCKIKNKGKEDIIYAMEST